MMLYGCTACGHVVFPARLLCHRCGGAAWTPVPCDRGVVTAVTTVQPDASLAEVLVPQNTRLIVRLRHPTPPGTSVALHEADGGALWGTIYADQA